MVPSTSFLGVIFALLSAITWGSGDFSGGYAARRINQYSIVVISAIVGLILMSLAALISGETLPARRDLLFAAVGGACGALGVAAFYRALAIGHNASVAPTAAVIGVSVPVIASAIIDGLPAPLKLLGFLAAALGIWLVSSPSGPAAGLSRQAFLLTVLSGLGFAGFLTLLGLVEPGRIFTPLAVARGFALITGLLLLRINHLPLPGRNAGGLPWLVGALDLLGNLFYILARQYTRLDIAVVLASLYPASTVVLAGLILKEKISPRQWLGVGGCLVAIVLITI